MRPPRSSGRRSSIATTTRSSRTSSIEPRAPTSARGISRSHPSAPRRRSSSLLPLGGALATAAGRVWGTGLLLDAQGNRIAVQSCADLGCLTRVFDLRHSGTAPLVIQGVAEGPMLGFAGAQPGDMGGVPRLSLRDPRLGSGNQPQPNAALGGQRGRDERPTVAGSSRSRPTQPVRARSSSTRRAGA